MKKSILFSLLVCGYLFSNNVSFSEEIVIPDLKEQKTESTVSASEVLATKNLSIVEIDGKYTIVDNKTQKNKLGMMAESIELFDDEFENEYKIKLKNEKSNSIITGYFNSETEDIIITNYSDMFLLGKYLKVKSGKKYGLIDKTGNTILMPIFDRVSLYTQDGKDYISTKINGKNKLYYTTGKLIPDEELYTVSNNGVYAIATDLKPEFKKYVLKARNANYLTNSAYEVEEIEGPSNVQIAAIEQNTIEIKPKEKEVDSKNILIGKNEYVVVKSGSNVGLTNIDGEEILPVEFDKLNITNLKNPILVTKKNGAISAFNIKGKILAEQVYDKINIYKYGKLYSYTKSDDNWILKSNNKKIGTLTVNDDGYTFVKDKYNLFSYKKVNDLFMDIINALKE